MTPHLTQLSQDEAPFFYYGSDIISDIESRALLDFFNTVPTGPVDRCDATQEFAFVTHTGTRSAPGDRAEAAAGDPIWLGDDWGAGVSLPDLVARLRDRVGELAASLPFEDQLGWLPQVDFTSVYVDRYFSGGRFFPHTDGEDAYGPVIAGASIGPGHAMFRLWGNVEVDRTPDAEFLLEPNSVYMFFGPIRNKPWLHAISDVTDLRYGITMRTRPSTRGSTTAR